MSSQEKPVQFNEISSTSEPLVGVGQPRLTRERALGIMEADGYPRAMINRILARIDEHAAANT